MGADIKTIVTEALKPIQNAPAPVKEGDPGGMSGVLENIPSTKVFGLPVGDAFKGLVAVGLGDVAVAILKSKLPPPTAGQINLTGALAKGAIAALYQTRQVKGFLGPTAANIGSLLLAIDAITEVVQVRTSVFNMIKRFTGTLVPGSGLVWPASPPTPQHAPPPTSVVVEAAARIADDYYARLGGS